MGIGIGMVKVMVMMIRVMMTRLLLRKAVIDHVLFQATAQHRNIVKEIRAPIVRIALAPKKANA